MPDGSGEFGRGSDDFGAAWTEALLAAALLATDPTSLGGVIIRGGARQMRDAWLAHLRTLLPHEMPVRRVPLHITDDRLLGGLDLAATLKAGRPIAERGLLAEADGGILVLPMAERLTAAVAARFTTVLDLKEVMLERDGIACQLPGRLAVVAFDEGLSEDERPPAALLDRAALHLRFDDIGSTEGVAAYTLCDVERAQALLPAVTVSDDLVPALCAAAVALGISSLNAPLLALRVARIAAALRGGDTVDDEDAALAARMVLAPRATRVPTDDAPPPPEPPAEEQQPSEATDGTGQIDNLIVAAAKAAIPPGLLALLRDTQRQRDRNRAGGKSGASKASTRRGRPAGLHRGPPQAGARLNLIETLRASAPWQAIRRRARATAPDGTSTHNGARIEVRADDFRVRRLKQRAEATTIFVVDASGSTALHRLAEAKGAVEMLLADCYIRRDQVALIAFSGRGAELLLPPTRSLARAKRNLADLPGGGGTPLAAGIDAAAALADGVRRKGRTPGVVMLTDGRGNLCRDGRPGRAPAEEDALMAARTFKISGFASLVVDTSQRPHAQAAHLAQAMGATYLPLPHVDAETLSLAVRRQRVGAAP